MGIVGRGSTPGGVIKEGEALFAVGTHGIMLTNTHFCGFPLQTRRINAFGRVPVAFTPGIESFFKIIDTNIIIFLINKEEMA